MKSTEGLVPLTPPTQKSAVLCTQPPAGEHHTKKADNTRQPKKLQRQHTQEPRDTRTCPAHRHTVTPPHHRHTTFTPSHIAIEKKKKKKACISGSGFRIAPNDGMLPQGPFCCILSVGPLLIFNRKTENSNAVDERKKIERES